MFEERGKKKRARQRNICKCKKKEENTRKVEEEKKEDKMRKKVGHVIGGEGR
jgi:hypothetical protein